MQRIEKNWGREEIIHADENYTCKKLVYTKPIASSLHYHPKKHETFVVQDGEFLLYTVLLAMWERKQAGKGGLRPMHRKLKAGDYVVLPPNTPHKIRCIVPGTIIEASTFDDPNDVVRLQPSETAPDLKSGAELISELRAQSNLTTEDVSNLLTPPNDVN